MSTKFQGFEKPKENWSKLPHQLIEALPKVETVGEMKIIIYTLRHTWGYRDDYKKITLDEFEKGRKNKKGERIDSGTGLTRPTIIDGIRRAIDHGFLFEYIDTSDKARVKKFYSLTEGGLKVFTPDVKEFDSKGKDSLPRSEKETKERKSINNSPQLDENEFPPIDPAFAKVCQLYKQEISSMFGSTTSDLLKDLADTYPLDWIEQAFKEAVKANVRRLNYIEGILKKWQEIGHPTLEKPKRTRAKEPDTERIDESQYVEVVPEEESHELAVDESWLDEQFARFREGRNDN